MPARNPAPPRRPPRRGQRSRPAGEQQHERQRERAADEERDGQRAEENEADDGVADGAQASVLLGTLVAGSGAVAEQGVNLWVALEAGADDMQTEEDTYQILTAPEHFHSILDAIKAKGIEPSSAEISMIPQNYIKLEGKDATAVVETCEQVGLSRVVARLRPAGVLKG